MTKRHEPHIRNKKPHDGFPFRHAAKMKIQGEQTKGGKRVRAYGIRGSDPIGGVRVVE